MFTRRQFLEESILTSTAALKPRTPADVDLYNPLELDADQWLETANTMGAKYAVFVAKLGTRQ